MFNSPIIKKKIDKTMNTKYRIVQDTQKRLKKL